MHCNPLFLRQQAEAVAGAQAAPGNSSAPLPSGSSPACSTTAAAPPQAIENGSTKSPQRRSLSRFGRFGRSARIAPMPLVPAQQLLESCCVAASEPGQSGPDPRDLQQVLQDVLERHGAEVQVRCAVSVLLLSGNWYAEALGTRLKDTMPCCHFGQEMVYAGVSQAPAAGADQPASASQ